VRREVVPFGEDSLRKEQKMVLGVLGNSNGCWRVDHYWLFVVADYAHHVVPTITGARRSWCSSGKELDANQARKLATELQRSVDDCSLDAYARRYFALLRMENNVPDSARFHDEHFDLRELPSHDQERRFVNEFVRQVQRFIEFLLACDGFAIL
jgi:hypothetical protein